MNAEEISWISKIFRKIDMFSSLSMADMGDLIDHMERKHYFKGEKIVKQGARGDSFFIIFKGKVKAAKKTAFIFNKTLAFLESEQFFGEMALLTDEPRSATITAMEDTDCFVLFKGHFENILKKNPSFAQLVRTLSEKRRSEKS